MLREVCYADPLQGQWRKSSGATEDKETAMSAKVTIRGANMSDLPNVITLWQEHQEYHFQCDPYFERSRDANPGFLEYLQDNLENIGLFVAEIEKQLVGFVLAETARRPACFASRDYGMIDDLAVTADWRGKGIGQQLLAQGMIWFAEKGIRRIETRVLNSNPLSTKFWQKAGFEPYISCVYKAI